MNTCTLMYHTLCASIAPQKLATLTSLPSPVTRTLFVGSQSRTSSSEIWHVCICTGSKVRMLPHKCLHMRSKHAYGHRNVMERVQYVSLLVLIARLSLVISQGVLCLAQHKHLSYNYSYALHLVMLGFSGSGTGSEETTSSTSNQPPSTSPSSQFREILLTISSVIAGMVLLMVVLLVGYSTFSVMWVYYTEGSKISVIVIQEV